MAYVDVYDAVTDQTSLFHKQVGAAMAAIAKDIRNESPGTEFHAERLAWADAVTSSPVHMEAQIGLHGWRIMENSTIAGEAPTTLDASVLFEVTALVNVFAGVA